MPVRRRRRGGNRGCLVGRAILVRSLFACHSLLAIWFLLTTIPSSITSQILRYIAGVGFISFVIESVYTIYNRHGIEWKWFCPSVFIYLFNVIPSIWMLELSHLEINNLGTTDVQPVTQDGVMSSAQSLTYNLSHVKGHYVNNSLHHNNVRYPHPSFLDGNNNTVLTKSLANLGLDISITLTEELITRILEQILLLILIIGRWLMPKGKLSHDQLSQLLLIYIGTAADIVEFFDAFKEKEVQRNPMLAKLVLAMWSWSLLQFTMVLTAGARNDHSRITNNQHMSLRTQSSADTARTRSLDSMLNIRPKRVCFSSDVYGIIFSIIMQDAPFLVLRLLLIFKYRVLSYTNLFFTCKNSLVISLLLYRLVMVQIERHNAWRISQKILAEESNLLERQQSLNVSRELIIDYRLAYDSGQMPSNPEVSNYVIKRHYFNDKPGIKRNKLSRQYGTEGRNHVVDEANDLHDRNTRAMPSNSQHSSLSIGDIINMDQDQIVDDASTSSVSL